MPFGSADLSALHLHSIVDQATSEVDLKLSAQSATMAALAHDKMCRVQKEHSKEILLQNAEDCAGAGLLLRAHEHNKASYEEAISTISIVRSTLYYMYTLWVMSIASSSLTKVVLSLANTFQFDGLPALAALSVSVMAPL
jgi:isochorismate synthase EntC